RRWRLPPQVAARSQAWSPAGKPVRVLPEVSRGDRRESVALLVGLPPRPGHIQTGDGSARSLELHRPVHHAGTGGRVRSARPVSSDAGRRGSLGAQAAGGIASYKGGSRINGRRCGVTWPPLVVTGFSRVVRGRFNSSSGATSAPCAGCLLA